MLLLTVAAILAIAPTVVIWLGSVHVTACISMSVVAAYLTFFPVVIATLRGLHAADRRADALLGGEPPDRVVEVLHYR